MQPVGPLMIEHRLIERMIKLMSQELQKIRQQPQTDTAFIDQALDFIKTYADKCHHGKEEDILFRDLAKKPLSGEYQKILNELIAEHKYARGIVGVLAAAEEKYLSGDKTSLNEIIGSIDKLIAFYPKHIEKEDKNFFLPVMQYFSEQEQEAMLKEFWEFDRKLIHEKYEGMVKKLEGGK